MLLTHRKLLQSKVIANKNDLRGTLLNFGLNSWSGQVRGTHQGTGCGYPRPGQHGRTAARCPAGTARAGRPPHSRLLAIVKDDVVCRRLMTIPGRRAAGGGTTYAGLGHESTLDQIVDGRLREGRRFRSAFDQAKQTRINLNLVLS